ncbi:hypothetical protein NBRC116494_30260 [Aurantivibrio plasticivorans]
MGSLAEQGASQLIADGLFECHIHEDWKVYGPDGGYITSILLRAVGQVSEHPFPISYFGQYLRVADFGKAQVKVECIKRGRQASAYEAQLFRNDKLVHKALVWTGIHKQGPDNSGLDHCLYEKPEFYVPLEEAGPRPTLGPFPFWDNLDIKKVKAGDGHFGQWYRFIPELYDIDPYLDAARSLVLIDTMQWPAAWHLHNGPMNYAAPSLDLSVRFHAFSETQWVFCNAVADVGYGGLLAGSGYVWDEDGKLLASGGSQSLCVGVG